MPNYKYYIGPWIKDSERDCWRSPNGAVGSICFGSLPECSISPTSKDSRAKGFFAVDSNENLGLDWLLVGQGDCREIIPSGEVKNSVVSLMGQTEGSTIADWLVYWLFESGGYDGQDKWKIGIPTREGAFEIHLGGHSKIYSRKFNGIVDKSWNRLRDLLRYDLQKHDDECKIEARKLKDEAKELRKQKKDKEARDYEIRAAKIEFHAESVLDAICIKFNCDPKEFSTEIQRGRARTTVTDDFSTNTIADYYQADGTWAISSGKMGCTSAGSGVPYSIAHNTAMSSEDHSTEADQLHADGGTQSGPTTRASGSAETHYHCRAYNPALVFGKVVSGTYTYLTGWTNTYVQGGVILLDSSGSTHTGKWNGAQKGQQTDSSITGLYRGGLSSDSAEHYPFGYITITDGITAAVNPKNIFRGIAFSGPFERNIL